MKRLFPLSLLSAAMLATGHTHAQSALEDSMLFLGTTTSNATGNYAYVLWQPSDPSMLLAHRLAVYRKNGDAASANPYTRISIIEPAEDTRLISSMLPKAQNLGEDLVELDTALSELLADVMPDTDVTLEQKISALVRESLTSREAKLQVTLLARQHPAIAFAAGEAFAEKVSISGPVTYELRDLDPATDKDLAVLGRVTLDPSSPFLLPAPDAPVEVRDTSSRGDLNCALRWGTPNNLRDLTPLHYGFDVWRVAKTAAIARGWDAAPPPAASDFLTEPAARKINLLAIMPSQTLTAIEAAATTPQPVFLIDDKGRYKDGGVPFNDGDEFYYFVTARDILGQGGVPSAGTLVQICDRMPTHPPRRVRVRNEAVFTTTTTPRDQHFVVEWDAPDLRPGESVSGYLVYRWYTPKELDSPMARHLDPVEGKPDWNLIAMLPGTQTSFVDDGTTPIPAWADFAAGPESQFNRPQMPAAADKTYFYTVRAIDNSLCENVSWHSAPAWGVLRDREGPAAPIGTLGVWCCRPTLDDQGNMLIDEAEAVRVPSSIRLFVATQLMKGLEWAEFRFDPPGPIGGDGPAPDPIFLGRRRFQKDSPASTLYVQLDRTFPAYTPGGRFYCRVATPEGAKSAWVPCNPDMLAPTAEKRLQFAWFAGLNCGFEPADLCGDRHKLIDPATGEMTDICGELTAAATSREYKIYRRVDDGPQTLIDQGEFTTSLTIMWCDENVPATLSTICYYAQTFDEHGNPSPMTRLGNCLEVGDPSYLPTPMLNELTGAFPMFPTGLRVNWFCNPAGVDRFEIWVARHSGNDVSPPSANTSDDLAGHPNQLTDDELAGLDFAVFETTAARILGSGTAPEYNVTLPVSPNDTYTVLVRAVGPGGYSARSVGAFSNAVTGGWSIQGYSLAPEVPWPARPLPPQADFHEGVVSHFLEHPIIAPWKSVGVRIGEYRDTQYQGENGIFVPDLLQGDAPIYSYHTAGAVDVETYLYRNDDVSAAETEEEIPGLILPSALYRVQVPNAKYPSVPGDIVQVSPMMEKIAQVETSLAAGTFTSVVDPFIMMLDYSYLPGLTPTEPEFTHAIFLIDRQPVLQGARYKYFLVRFDPTKEIERVIVTNDITIP